MMRLTPNGQPLIVFVQIYNHEWQKDNHIVKIRDDESEGFGW
jgi:hypothetical protein